MPNKTCFIIMPFSETTKEHTEAYWDSHFEGFIKPIIEEVGGIDVFRSEALRGDVLKKIILDLSNSDIVVADLTDSNPNVYWELGIRHSLKNGTITIKDADYKRRVFDVSTIGTLNYYTEDYIKNEKFKKQFKKAIKDCCDNKEKIDSYVLDILAGRNSIYEIVNKDEIKRKIEGLEQEYIYNNSLYNKIMKHSSNNIENREKILSNPQHAKQFSEKIKFTTNRFRYSSLELLITTRYIDEKIDLYQSLEDCVDIIFSMNEQINEWLRASGHIEKWFISSKKGHDEEIEKYKKSIDYLKEKYMMA